MKNFIKGIVFLSCISFSLFSGEALVRAEESHTTIKVELVKPILPGEYPDNNGNENSRPKDGNPALKSDNHLTVVNKVKKTNIATIVRSQFGKLLPKSGEKNNSWSIAGWGILLFLLLVAFQKRKERDN